MIPLTHIPPNSISISSAVFAHFTRVPNTQTDRHTDHATWDICSNRLQLCTAYRWYCLNVVLGSVVGGLIVQEQVVHAMPGRLSRKRLGKLHRFAFICFVNVKSGSHHYLCRLIQD